MHEALHCLKVYQMWSIECYHNQTNTTIMITPSR